MASRNSGKLHTSKYTGDENAIPAQYVVRTGRRKLTQKNPTEQEPDALTAAVIASSIEVDRNDEAQRTTEVLGTDADATLPMAITDKKVIHDNGGGILSIVSTLDSAAQVPTGGLLITTDEVNDLNGVLNERVTGTIAGTEWPLLFGTQKLNRTSIINIDVGRQAVAAGQIGQIYTPATIAISTIHIGNPGFVDLAAPHFCYPGDLITIASVSGGTSINGTQTVDVVAPNGDSMAQRLYLRGVNITSAGTGGTIINQNPNRVFVDVEPIDRWLSTRLYSRVNTATSLIGTANGITYPASFEWRLPTAVTGLTFPAVADDIGCEYVTTPGRTGQFPGYVTVYQFTRAQLAAWISGTFSGVHFEAMLPGGESSTGEATSDRVFTFRFPKADIAFPGSTGPAGAGTYFQVTGELLQMDMVEVRVSEIVL